MRPFSQEPYVIKHGRIFLQKTPNLSKCEPVIKIIYEKAVLKAFILSVFKMNSSKIVKCMQPELQIQTKIMTILKNNEDFFIYFFENRWRIGENYREADCWIFSETQRNGIREISANMDWFSNDKKGRKFKAPVRITSISSLRRSLRKNQTNKNKKRSPKIHPKKFQNSFLRAFICNSILNIVIR